MCIEGILVKGQERNTGDTMGGAKGGWIFSTCQMSSRGLSLLKLRIPFLVG